jgi:oligopeptide transport system ATP-binding protein
MNQTADKGHGVSAQVEVKNLVKHFIQGSGFLRRNPRVVRAVDGVSLKIDHKRTLGLVGESGCGKTTIGRCILRLIEPTAGEVYFEGVDVLGLSGGRLRRMRRDMQMVFQNPYSSLDPRMSVLGIVGEPLQTHTSLSHAEVRDRVIELLQQVGMSGDHMYRYPHEFSGGQLQRIAVARALALNPKFLVLDEPTAALDVSVQAQVISKITELQRELELTYLFISHNLTLVHYVSDTIAVTYLGRIVEYAGADEIFDSPLHPYTVALLSATPSLDREARQQRVILKGRVPDPANPPSGCVFHPRCPRATPDCSEQEPKLVDVGDGHMVACHL